MNKLLTVSQAAKKLGVHIERVMGWIDDGTLGVVYPSPFGYEIREEECVRLLALLKKAERESNKGESNASISNSNA